MRFKEGHKRGPAWNDDVWFEEDGMHFHCRCGHELAANQHGQVVVCGSCGANILFVLHTCQLDVHHPESMKHGEAVRIVADRWLKRRRLLATERYKGSWEET